MPGRRLARCIECLKPTEVENVAEVNGRGGEIRTHDPLRPRQVRYQAALRPDILLP